MTNRQRVFPFSGSLKMTRTIPLTQGQVAIVDDEDFDWLNQYKWHAEKMRGRYYAARYLKGNKKMLMHREIMNAPKGVIIDHINGSSLENRRKNLRPCTIKENQRNRVSQKNSSSRFKGVCWHKNRKKWQAEIRCEDKFIYLGSFDNEIEAAKAYDKKAKELFGDFAKTNF